jgi:uncharacterized protein (UPF0335 family)
MQLGRLEVMDQSRVNHIEKISKIERLEEHNKTIEEDEYKKHQDKNEKALRNEVLLDNVKFGYDYETKEFFIRVSKGEMEYQFPTDQILKLKSHLQETLISQTQKK